MQNSFLKNTSQCYALLNAAKVSEKYKTNEPAPDNTYNKTCAINEDSDQLAQRRCLIRVFAGRKCLQQPSGYPKDDTCEPFRYWVNVQADLSPCWSHRSYCRYYHALAQIIIICCNFAYRLKGVERDTQI